MPNKVVSKLVLVLVLVVAFLGFSSGTGPPITIHSLSLDGNRDANARAGDVLVLRARQSTVHDVEILGAARHAIRLTNLSADGTPLDNTQVNGRISANHIFGSGGSGIFVEDTRNSVTDWQLTDNWIGDSGTDGIALTNAAGWMIQRNHLYGNAIRGNGTGIGLDYQPGSGAACAVTSTGNLVTGVSTPRRVASGVTVTAGV